MSKQINSGLKVKFYQDSRSKKYPAKEYIDNLPPKEQQKILSRISALKEHEGFLREPYSRHIKGKIRELKIGFARKRHRLLYFIMQGRKIILLHAFLKKTKKTPRNEIQKAEQNYFDALNNKHFYE